MCDDFKIDHAGNKSKLTVQRYDPASTAGNSLTLGSGPVAD